MRFVLWSWLCLFAVEAEAQAAPPAGPTRADEAVSAAPASDEASLGAVATANRLARPQRDVPANVTVLRRDEIDRNPSLTSDSLLRSLPSVATFRRSTSLVADPSSQGLNLRGVGPSGVSRTLVLVDGVPANDPFGGWIVWRALPRLGMERIEVVPGGGSALYGSGALAGVVQVFSRTTFASRFDADASYGLRNTLHLGARGARAWQKAGAALEGEWLSSDGFQVVAREQRGAVDRAAASRHGTLNGKVELLPLTGLKLTTSLGLFHEDQNGGTRFTNAEVDMATLMTRADLDLSAGGALELTVFARSQEFQQERARFSEDRATESRSARQRVPSQDEGGSCVWTSPTLSLAASHVFSAGVDARHLAGTSKERLYPVSFAPEAPVRRDAGGAQWLLGAFVQDLVSVTSWLQLDAALRADFWRNDQGLRSIRDADGSEETTRFTARSAYSLSPRAGLLVRPLDWLALRSSVYRSFRAPTPNELYRSFQVGTIVTAANPRLGPEYLVGAEGGVEVTPFDTLLARATAFGNRLEDPITNVTLTTPLADGSQRRRENLGQARIRGLELGLEWRAWRRLTFVLAYTLAASKVTRAPGFPDLVGKRLPQDPVHRGSALVLFDEPKWISGSLQARYVGAQYEDDLNTLRMPGYTVLDASLQRRLFWHLELFAAVENLLNQSYLVGRAGVDTVGAFWLARVGLRIRDAFEPKVPKSTAP